MAAEVGYNLRRLLNGGDDTESGKQTAMITRDLLGGRSNNLLDFKELDLDMHVPSGWEKRLDLKSGKVYIQKRDSMNSTTSKSEEKKVNDAISRLQDLNFPPSPKQPSITSSDDGDANPIDLNLVLFPSSSSAASPPPAATSTTNFYCVCTLDKVKFALERAEKETNAKRSRSMSKRTTSSSPPSPSRSSSSVIDSNYELMEDEEKMSNTFAAGCPKCLLYVLVSRNNPVCPQCSSTVPSPTKLKKPRIDLNISL